MPKTARRGWRQTVTLTLDAESYEEAEDFLRRLLNHRQVVKRDYGGGAWFPDPKPTWIENKEVE